MNYAFPVLFVLSIYTSLFTSVCVCVSETIEPTLLHRLLSSNLTDTSMNSMLICSHLSVLWLFPSLIALGRVNYRQLICIYGFYVDFKKILKYLRITFVAYKYPWTSFTSLTSCFLSFFSPRFSAKQLATLFPGKSFTCSQLQINATPSNICF